MVVGEENLAIVLEPTEWHDIDLDAEHLELMLRLTFPLQVLREFVELLADAYRDGDIYVLRRTDRSAPLERMDREVTGCRADHEELEPELPTRRLQSGQDFFGDGNVSASGQVDHRSSPKS